MIISFLRHHRLTCEERDVCPFDRTSASERRLDCDVGGEIDHVFTSRVSVIPMSDPSTDHQVCL